MGGWGDGGMEGWRDGGMEGWRDGGMEGWRDGVLRGDALWQVRLRGGIGELGNGREDEQIGDWTHKEG
jgi:hypothetical protein